MRVKRDELMMRISTRKRLVRIQYSDAVVLINKFVHMDKNVFVILIFLIIQKSTEKKKY